MQNKQRHFKKQKANHRATELKPRERQTIRDHCRQKGNLVDCFLFDSVQTRNQKTDVPLPPVKKPPGGRVIPEKEESSVH